MDNYSYLNGTAPISPTSVGVWKIQKKRRTDDHRRQHNKKDRKDKEEKDTIEISSGHESIDDNETITNESEEHVVYDSKKKLNKSPSRKIDLNI